MPHLSAAQEEQLAYSSGSAFYVGFFFTLLISLLFVYFAYVHFADPHAVTQYGVRTSAVRWTGNTWFVGIVLSFGLAFAVGFVCGLFTSFMGNPEPNPHFWSIPVHQEDESLMTDFVQRQERPVRRSRAPRR